MNPLHLPDPRGHVLRTYLAMLAILATLLLGLSALVAPASAEPGGGNGVAGGRPSDGAVGNADPKSPDPQEHGVDNDANSGHECDGNNGIGQGNPAHTGCASPAVTDAPSSPPGTTPPSQTAEPTFTPAATSSPQSSATAAPSGTAAPSTTPTTTSTTAATSSAAPPASPLTTSNGGGGTGGGGHGGGGPVAPPAAGREASTAPVPSPSGAPAPDSEASPSAAPPAAVSGTTDAPATVDQVPASAGPVRPRSLPFSGAPTASLLALAAGLSVAGLLLALAGRRQRTE